MELFHIIELSSRKILLNSDNEPFEFHNAEQAQGVVNYLRDKNPSENWMARGEKRYRLWRNLATFQWISERN